MSPYEELRLLLSILAEGETRGSQLCPFCRGGREGETSLSITRFTVDSGAYICHRAKCGREGYIGKSYGTHRIPDRKPKEFEPRIYRGNVTEVPDHVIRQFCDKYGWTEDDCRESGFGWDSERLRTVWKVASPSGAIRGWELRAARDEDRPKTLHYRHTSEPWAGYVLSRSPERSRLVAVEDLLSAYRVGQVYPAVSIMGSHLSFDLLMDLMKVSENIVLCLDRDATEKAEKFTKRYAFICPNIVHVPIQRDLKYETTADIKTIIESVL